MVCQIKTLFTGPNVVGGGVSTIATDDPPDAGAMQDLVDSVHAFWTEIATIADEDLVINIEDTVNRYAATSGALQQIFAVDGGTTIVGGNSGNAVPRASQALIRWNTEEIVGGRLLRGRTFVPGMPAASLTDAGGFSSAYAVTLQSAADGLIADTGNFVQVWHRPVSGAGGSAHMVMNASVWDEFAVLRSRRD